MPRAPYRQPSTPSRKRVPDQRIAFSRFGLPWFAGVVALTIASGIVAVSLASRTFLECDAPPGRDATCALVTKRAFGDDRRAVNASAYSLRVQTALVGGSDGPALAVELASRGTRWFRLGPQNDAIASAWRAYVRALTPRFEVELESTVARCACLPLAGIVVLLVMLALERRTRIDVDLDDGVVEASTRGWFVRTREVSRRIDEIDRVETWSTIPGASIVTVHFVRHDAREPIADAPEERAREIASTLDAIVKEWRQRDARAGRA
jgi:hypothetical protein